MKNQKGITLIALVITIIVLLILAGITIAMLTGDNGLLTKASDASVQNSIGAAKDKVAVLAADAVADYYEDTYVGTTASAPYSDEGVNQAVHTAITSGMTVADGVTATWDATNTNEIKLTYTKTGQYVTATLVKGAFTNWSAVTAPAANNNNG